MSAQGQRILCVDDHAANLVALEAVLEMPGVELLLAGSGDEALDLLAAAPDIALALLDVQMGGMDGYQLAERMRSRPELRQVPIIFLTAINKDARHVFQGYESGAVDYIFKPLEPRILRSKVEFFLALDRDKRALRQALDEARVLRDNQSALLRSVGEGILGVDATGAISFANPAAERMLQRDASALAGRPLRDCVQIPELDGEPDWAASRLVRAVLARPDPLAGIQGRALLPDGATRPLEITAAALRGGAPDAHGLTLVLQDVSERREYEARLLKMAEYDSLTGLANRYLCLNLLNQAIARSARTGSPLAVLFLDLDRFKQVNDSMGHAVGDELLREVARRLRHCVREGDSVCRLGGDEFVVILEGMNASHHAANVSDKIIRTLGEVFIVQGSPVFIGASIGIVTYPETTGDADALLRCADIAMYQAKHRGRNNYQFFTGDMQEKVLRAQCLEVALRDALERDAFELWYQPLVRVADDRVVGLEALVRWRREDGTLAMPADFIPLAEETGLIVDIGAWVLGEAARQANLWHEARGIDLPVTVSVNLSVRQVRGHSVIEALHDILARLALPPERLVIEITEHMVMDDPAHMLALLNDIRALGVHITLDDFGVGYSSFGHLKRMPVSALKIDRSFIADIDTSERSRQIVAAIVAMARALDVTPMAEVVETPAQRDTLATLGVEVMQGYCFREPMTVTEVEAFLAGR